jgi:surface polysaccharide O-acyltransferase-like enzyme
MSKQPQGNPMTSNNNRIVFLDYLRVIACFFVMMVHSSEWFYGPEDGNLILSESHRLWIGIWDGMSRISVPLFMICSAYLLLPMKENVSWTDFYKRRFLRVVPPMLVFMVLYCIIPALTGMVPWSYSLKSLASIPLNFPMTAGHLWFMYPLLGMYLLIPVLSPWLRNATAGQERFLICIWLVTTCIPYLNRWFGDVWGQCWWNRYDMLYNFAGYPGYFLLAHYIREHIHWSRGKRMGIGIVCTIIGAVATILSFYIQAVPAPDGMPRNDLLTKVEIGWCFCTINCVVFTFGVFLLFTCIEKAGKCYPVILDISKTSYGMYLMHVFFLYMIAPLLTPILPLWAAIPLIAAATYVASYVAARLISLIPGSKWVIG